jgi:hypothetical protein
VFHRIVVNSTFTHSQILCVIPVAIVRWVLVGVAFLLSGYFLVVNTWPILATVRRFRPQTALWSDYSYVIVGRSKSCAVGSHHSHSTSRCSRALLQSALLQLLREAGRTKGSHTGPSTTGSQVLMISVLTSIALNSGTHTSFICSGEKGSSNVRAVMRAK